MPDEEVLRDENQEQQFSPGRVAQSRQEQTEQDQEGDTSSDGYTLSFLIACADGSLYCLARIGLSL